MDWNADSNWCTDQGLIQPTRNDLTVGHRSWRIHEIFNLIISYSFDIAKSGVKGMLLVLLIGLIASPARAILSGKTGQIQGRVPTASGYLQVLLPDGVTMLTDNAMLGIEHIPNQFMISSSIARLVLHDTDGDSGLSALIDTDRATLTWKYNGTKLSPTQLSTPFGNNFPDGDLTLEVSAPVTVISKTGLPNTGIPVTLTSTYTVFLRTPRITQGDLTVIIDNSQANGVATNAVRALVTDAYAKPVAGQSVDFTASNGVKVVAATAITNASGVAITTLTSTTAGISTVTATVNGSSQSVEVIFSGQFTGISANGHTFTINAGFPSTGFNQAKFTLNMNGVPDNYTWSSNQAGVTVDNTGQVTLSNAPSGTVMITATPKVRGNPLIYTFTVRNWFINNGPTKTDWNTASNWCTDQGLIQPTRNDLTLGHGSRRIGSLWSEWGDMGNFSGSGFITEITELYWTSETTFDGNFGVYLRDGSNFVTSSHSYAVCR